MADPYFAQPSKLIPCFDFTKGQCMRGDSCKYSHDIAHIVAVNSQERGVCFDFLRGQCNRGLLCRFSHDLSGIMARQQLQQMQGVSAATRRNAPICYEFVKGMCMRGAECRYSHDITSVINGTRGRNSSPDEVCFDFLRGKCNRGRACRYSHDVPANKLPGAQPSAEQLQQAMLMQLPGGAPMGASFPDAMQAGLAARMQPQFAACSAGLPLQGVLPVRPTNEVLQNVTNLVPAHPYGAAPYGLHFNGCNDQSAFGQQSISFDFGDPTSDMYARLAALQVAQVSQAPMQHQVPAPPSNASANPNVNPFANVYSSQSDLAAGMMAMQLDNSGKQDSLMQKKLSKGSSFDLSGMPHTSANDKIGAVWEQQATTLPPLVTVGRSLPPSGACTPRTPALAVPHPFSIPYNSHSFQPSSLNPASSLGNGTRMPDGAALDAPAPPISGQPSQSHGSLTSSGSDGAVAINGSGAFAERSGSSSAVGSFSAGNGFPAAGALGAFTAASSGFGGAQAYSFAKTQPNTARAAFGGTDAFAETSISQALRQELAKHSHLPPHSGAASLARTGSAPPMLLSPQQPVKEQASVEADKWLAELAHLPSGAPTSALGEPHMLTTLRPIWERQSAGCF